MKASRPEVAIHLLILLLFTAGCRQDMYDQPRMKPYRESTFFSDGTSARPLPPHTVPHASVDAGSTLASGVAADGFLADDLPMELSPALLARGRERFDIFCAVCHGQTGAGNGMIVQRGFPEPPSFHLDRLRNAPIGYFVNVIQNGYGVMYPQATRVDPPDRWAIAAYIRALQLSRNATPGDVPAPVRAKLEEGR